MTLEVVKGGDVGDEAGLEVMLPDECASVTVALKAPKASIGKLSLATVTTVAGRVLHSFGKITRMASSWTFRPSANFALMAGDVPDTPSYRLSASCVLTMRGANEWNALSGY